MPGKLKAIRLANAVTQKQISAAIGISASYYCQIENGSRRLSLRLAQAIARFFHVTLDELFMDGSLSHNAYRRQLNSPAPNRSVRGRGIPLAKINIAAAKQDTGDKQQPE